MYREGIPSHPLNPGSVFLYFNNLTRNAVYKNATFTIPQSGIAKQTVERHPSGVLPRRGGRQRQEPLFAEPQHGVADQIVTQYKT